MSNEPEPSPEEQLFDAALALPATQRAGFVQGRAGGDRALASRVIDLLAAHETAGAFLERPAVTPPPDQREAAVREAPGTILGPYELIEEIGEGGFGVVWRAHQELPVRREVALKIIKLGMDTRQVIARFEAERQALAVLDHPNIARVLDAGATSTGRPYFVMELVDGEDITTYCDRHRLTTVERVELFRDVCAAIQHAHQKGLIHRDIKPSNILVGAREGAHVPKVIDFGIAKATKQRLTDATLHTEAGQIIGTPVYMSPEQAERGEAEVDTRSDIYSLGIVLYELLSGTTPFVAGDLKGRGLAEIQEFIREHEPTPPSQRASRAEERELVATERRVIADELIGQLRGDLDWIVLRALEKEPSRRYATTADLAEDLDRYLGHLPVLAGPPSQLYRARKFVRRHRILVAASAIAVVAIVAGVGVMLYGLYSATKERDMAGRKQNLLERTILATSGSRAAGLESSDLDALEIEVGEVFGQDSPLYAGVLRLRAERLWKENRPSAAGVAFERALEAAEVTFGPASAQRAELLVQFGLMHHEQGDVERARAELEEALELEPLAYGGLSYLTNPARHALAKLDLAENRPDQGLQRCGEAWNLVVEQAPDDLEARYNAALNYLETAAALQRFDRIEEVFEELLALTDLRYPGPTARRANLRRNFAAWNAMQELAPPEVVAERLREALAIYEQLVPRPVLDIADTRQQLATLLFMVGGASEREEGIEHAEECLALYRERYPNDPRRRIEPYSQLARLFQSHRVWDRATRTWMEVVRIKRSLDGDAANYELEQTALLNIAEPLVTDPTVEPTDPSLREAAIAMRQLDRWAPQGYKRFRQLRNGLLLRANDPSPALDMIGGIMGSRTVQAEREHPYDLAVGAWAQKLNEREDEALRLLALARERAQKPEFANDLRTQRMIQFATRYIEGNTDLGGQTQEAVAVEPVAPADSTETAGEETANRLLRTILGFR